MQNKKSGTSMSNIENIRNVSSIRCDCKKCYHSVKKDNIYYCKYYDLFNPNKSKCVRFSSTDEFQNKKFKKGKKKPTFPWETQ